MGKKKHNIFSTKLIKGKDNTGNDKMKYRTPAERKLYDEFVKALTKGQRVMMFLEAYDDSKTLSQLAKVHACIREIATEQGESFKEAKKSVKEAAGLYVEFKGMAYEKSFEDCSVSEMTLVVEAIIEIGDFIGINFRGQFLERHQKEDQQPAILPCSFAFFSIVLTSDRTVMR